MIYMRGNRVDYDGWAARGCPGWGYEDLLPYFRRAEDNERGESYYHGVGGPLTVSDGRSMHPLVAASLEAAVDAGIAPIDDHNGPIQEGVGWFQFTQRQAGAGARRSRTCTRRSSAATSTCSPMRSPRACCSSGERAVGVEVLRKNRWRPCAPSAR